MRYISFLVYKSWHLLPWKIRYFYPPPPSLIDLIPRKMSAEIIKFGSNATKNAVQGQTMKVFTGEVYVTLVHQGEGYNVASVAFSPGAHTFWHKHSKGQILQVTSGVGWVGEKGKTAQKFEAGDIVICPKNVPHWHGADKNHHMVHTAISRGDVEWMEKVKSEEMH